jgi:hypothetical protein
MSCHQNAGQNDNINTADRWFANVATLRYLEMTLTSQNCVHEERNGGLSSASACCHSVQNIVASLLLKNTEHKMAEHITVFCLHSV